MPTDTTAPASLTDAQRDKMLALLERDGFAELPFKLPPDLMQRCLRAIDRIAQDERAKDPSTQSVKRQNCVDLDPAFLELVMFEPALQLCHDVFGPMFHLNQSNFISRLKEDNAQYNNVTAIDWHADGPRPRNFPRVDGKMGLHYLKFGYFFTDLAHGTGGSLEIVRGTHKRDELDGLPRERFDIANYAQDHLKLDCEAGTIICFHQALWHSAHPNQSDIERKNAYISYCPTWMRPVDRDFPSEAGLAGKTPEQRWILGEPRPALRWWLPQGDDAQRLARYAR